MDIGPIAGVCGVSLQRPLKEGSIHRAIQVRPPAAAGEDANDAGGEAADRALEEVDRDFEEGPEAGGEAGSDEGQDKAERSVDLLA